MYARRSGRYTACTAGTLEFSLFFKSKLCK